MGNKNVKLRTCEGFNIHQAQKMVRAEFGPFFIKATPNLATMTFDFKMEEKIEIEPTNKGDRQFMYIDYERVEEFQSKWKKFKLIILTESENK